MKIRVPFAWFWYGDNEYGTPEVESGTIASANPNPKPPPQALNRYPPGMPAPLHAGEVEEEELVPYVPPTQRKAETVEEKVDRLERELSQSRSAIDRVTRGPDAR